MLIWVLFLEACTLSLILVNLLGLYYSYYDTIPYFTLHYVFCESSTNYLLYLNT